MACKDPAAAMRRYRAKQRAKHQNGDVRADGFVFRSGQWHSPEALVRQVEYSRRYEIDNRDRVAAARRRWRDAHQGAYQRERRQQIAARAYYLLQNCRARGRERGVEFSLTKPWLVERLTRGVCEASGLPFVLERHSAAFIGPFSPSLDRRDPAQGYTETNTLVVITMHNFCKGQWGPDEHRRYIEAMAQAYGLIEDRRTPFVVAA